MHTTINCGLLSGPSQIPTLTLLPPDGLPSPPPLTGMKLLKRVSPAHVSFQRIVEELQSEISEEHTFLCPELNKTVVRNDRLLRCSLDVLQSHIDPLSSKLAAQNQVSLTSRRYYCAILASATLLKYHSRGEIVMKASLFSF